MKKIDFVVAGFQKCGTTTLYEILRQNRHIFLPEEKETYFFSDDRLYGRGMGYYYNRFYKDVQENQIVGTVDPTFVFYMDRMQKKLGKEVKYIFILRNPVKMVFSFYKMLLQMGFLRFGSCGGGEKNKGFDYFINKNLRVSGGRVLLKKSAPNMSVITSGLYVEYLKKFYASVDGNRIKIIFFEEFIKDIEKYMEDLFAFLNVPSVCKNCNVQANPDLNLRPKNNLCKRVTQLWYKDIRGIERRGGHLPKWTNCCEDLLLKYVMTDNKEQASCESEHILKTFYESSIRELENLIGRDLSEVWF